MDDLDQELNDLVEVFSFREKIAAIVDGQLSKLQSQIEARAHRGFREYRVFLTERDVNKRLFRKPKLIGYGQTVYTQLVQLGFDPEIDWTFLSITIRW